MRSTLTGCVDAIGLARAADRGEAIFVRVSVGVTSLLVFSDCGTPDGAHHYSTHRGGGGHCERCCTRYRPRANAVSSVSSVMDPNSGIWS